MCIAFVSKDGFSCYFQFPLSIARTHYQDIKLKDRERKGFTNRSRIRSIGKGITSSTFRFQIYYGIQPQSHVKNKLSLSSLINYEKNSPSHRLVRWMT